MTVRARWLAIPLRGRDGTIRATALIDDEDAHLAEAARAFRAAHMPYVNEERHDH